MNDNIYPLHLGPSIEPSATLSAWGFRGSKPVAAKVPLIETTCANCDPKSKTKKKIVELDERLVEL